MKTLLLLTISLLLSSCTGVKYQKPWDPDLPYDTQEKALLATYGILQAGDTYTTDKALGLGAVEANYLYGEHPNTEVIILTKLIAFGLIWSGMPYLNHTQRKWMLWPLNILMGGVVLNNSLVIKEIEDSL